MKTTHKTQIKKQNKWVWIVIGFLVIGVIGASGLLNGNNETLSLPAAITVENASERYANGAYLLDVREQSEWNEAHVEGAVLIPLGELSNRIAEIPANQDVLIICRSGNRSGQARDILRAAGLMRTTSITGGINQWTTIGLPVISGP
ncbi:MAG: hypothetical protein FD147_1101 [Chloroflexi bacterium]|nr:MAG: hypothetical protein FD147_1101 [Chloroflexota bacterium]MBA4375171.1 rhodanese-like domain-containing protein [Anaerolinea sp.]